MAAEQAFAMLRRGGTATVIGMIPIGEFKSRLAQMCREIKATPLAAGAGRSG